MEKNAVHHLTVVGANPHTIASELGQEGSPFADDRTYPGVHQHDLVDDIPVSGIVEVWTAERLTPEQERFVRQHPHLTDVAHVWP